MAAGFFGQRTGSLEELALVLLVLLILLLIAGALLVLLVLLLIVLLLILLSVLLLILLIVLLLILLPAVLLLVLFVRHDDNLHTFTHSEIFDESSGKPGGRSTCTNGRLRFPSVLFSASARGLCRQKIF